MAGVSAEQQKPPPDTEREAPARLSVREVVDPFMADAQARLKLSTLGQYRADADALCDAFGRAEADGLSPISLSAWLAQWKAGPTTKAIRLRSLSAMFGWAVRHGLATTNPVKAVPRPKARSRSRDAVVSEADHARLTAAASPAFGRVLAVLHATGCRPGEACRITAANFYPGNVVAELDEHKADKSGKPRLVFLPSDVGCLLSGLAVRHPDGPLLRTDKGNPWTGRSITEAMQKLKRRAGVKAMAYGYRHAFCTSALVNGVPDSTVAALLGHGSTAMIHKHYSHVASQAQAMRNALARVRG